MGTGPERELYETSNSIIIRWDNKGVIRYINKVGLQFFGYSSEELIGQDVRCLIPDVEKSTGRDLSCLARNIIEIPAEHVVFENENLTKDGKTVWIAWTNQAIRNDQGEVIEILAIGNCISALKESEENLAKEKAFLRTVIDSAEDLIYFKDRNSTYIGCNKASEKFTGRAECEQVGRSDFDFFDQAQAEAIVKDDRNILENRTAVHTEDWVTSPVSGEPRVLDTVKAPILGPDGQAIGLVGISRDITERKKAEREITEANNFNQIIIENSPVGILVFKESGQCVQANPAAEIIVGASSEQMLKLNFREMESYKKTGIFADMEEVLRTGVSIKKEIRTTNTFGKEVWFEGVISTFRKNEEKYILYIFTDIMQSKKALEVLQKSEVRHRTILQTAMDGIWFVDNKGCFLEVNESYCLMSGYSKQELLTMCISDVENIESPEDTIAHLEELKDSGNVRFISQHRRKDGRPFEVEVTAQALNEDDLSYVAFLRDITEQKKTELELKNSEEKTRLILDSAAEAIYGLDSSGHCTFCNRSCLNILGYGSEEDLLGRNIHEVIHHTTAEGLPNPVGECQIFKSFKHGEKIHIEIDHLWKADGTNFPAEVWSHPIQKDDAIIGTVVTFNDITKQRQSEERRLKLEDQLRQSQKMEAIGTMAGGIAHDFNNLLAIIGGNLDLLQFNQQAGKPIDENLEHIREASDRAKNLVAQILAFSRQEQKELVPVNLTTFVGQSLKFLRPVIPTTVELMTEAPKDPVHIHADTTKLQQVLINLCSNALHAMDEKGLLRISLAEGELTSQEVFLNDETQAGRYAKLSVADTGKGMDKKTLDRIFDPFFTTKGIGEGTGMGLSVVHGIIEQHGGFIRVDSTPGQGTTFTLYFPATGDVEATEEADAETTLSTGTERILFVDDEQSVANVCGSMLGHLGYKVTIMTNSLEALELFRSGPDDFDLVITDQTMPKMSGVELARELLKIRPSIPIILCSGYSAQVTDENVLEVGIQAFCMKPVEMKQLAAVARQTLDAVKQPSVTG